MLDVIIINGFGHPAGITMPSYVSLRMMVFRQTILVETEASSSLALGVSLLSWAGDRVYGVD